MAAAIARTPRTEVDARAGQIDTVTSASRTPLKGSASITTVAAVLFSAIVASLFASSSSTLPVEISPLESSELTSTSSMSENVAARDPLDWFLEFDVGLPVDVSSVAALFPLEIRPAELMSFGFFLKNVECVVAVRADRQTPVSRSVFILLIGFAALGHGHSHSRDRATYKAGALQSTFGQQKYAAVNCS